MGRYEVFHVTAILCAQLQNVSTVGLHIFEDKLYKVLFILFDS